MSRFRVSLIVLIVLMTATLTFVVCLQRHRAASQRLQSAQTRLTGVHGDAQRVLDLRARSATVAAGQRPTEDVLAVVNGVLADAGIESRRLRNVAPEADVSLPTSGTQVPSYRRQTMRITLSALRLDELVRFLTTWKRTDHIWTVERVELVHVRQGRDPSAYDCSLVIAATYFAEDA